MSHDLQRKFVLAFGAGVAPDERHVDMPAALRVQLLESGCAEERLCDANICTFCEPDRFFSYRRQAGICGRHGAFACRIA